MMCFVVWLRAALPCLPGAGAAFFVFIIGWFFDPMDARETCVGPCVVAAAYTAVVD